ncbi:MAG: tRNA (N6-threonylcarbamoyladenosine(37)-N6)-methyltransferase TrmO [Candidatus Auribacter fodinae]|jgi:tRNA-Thr(GGU) m(6)t(6)A37 methyltransferase TsaA|uniref:tRNA (N6-threonylcarbamoyladenosine(37)-N6)-methyltransferase TrmO n=1 Tax=Candidatus Auribacter fodinae TaxID=2093366 RepID=A0A3A4R6Q0_9BACT|nr:MAG: tRNA (N6-threonylcarbamoyladenosine(37)-N6)-methyltransferase TrmO [Candidatus Auribacter fodinae]
MDTIAFSPIGIIHSLFRGTVGVPIQPSLSQGALGTVEVYPEYMEGLASLDRFSHIYLIYYFHLSKGYSLTVKPFLDAASHGVFATRAPKRPNGIGISVVELMRIEKNVLHIKNIDIVDGTPLLDIKPYARTFDWYATTKDGWLADKTQGVTHHCADDRFTDKNTAT